MALAARQRISFEEYVRIEAMSAIRHEWLDGSASGRSWLDRSVPRPPGVRFRWVLRRKNAIARGEARRQLHQLRQLNRLRPPQPDAEPECPAELPEELDPLMW